MKVVGFAGYSGAGKTTLVERLVLLSDWGSVLSCCENDFPS